VKGDKVSFWYCKLVGIRGEYSDTKRLNQGHLGPFLQGWGKEYKFDQLWCKWTLAFFIWVRRTRLGELLCLFMLIGIIFVVFCMIGMPILLSCATVFGFLEIFQKPPGGIEGTSGDAWILCCFFGLVMNCLAIGSKPHCHTNWIFLVL